MDKNPELYYLMNCWPDLAPDAELDITTTLLIDRVKKLPSYLIDEVVKQVSCVPGVGEGTNLILDLAKRLDPVPLNRVIFDLESLRDKLETKKRAPAPKTSEQAKPI